MLAANLRPLGYDDLNLSLMSYDWRLNIQDVEVRDRYFVPPQAGVGEDAGDA